MVHEWCMDGAWIVLLLMEEILHQFIGSLPHYLQGFSTIPGGFLVGFLNHQPYILSYFGSRPPQQQDAGSWHFDRRPVG